MFILLDCISFLFLIGALRDLDTAIDLAAKYNDSRVTGLAYAQKGTILRLKGL